MGVCCVQLPGVRPGGTGNFLRIFLRMDIEIVPEFVPESILKIVHTKHVQIFPMDICCVYLSGVRPEGKR